MTEQFNCDVFFNNETHTHTHMLIVTDNVEYSYMNITINSNMQVMDTVNSSTWWVSLLVN